MPHVPGIPGMRLPGTLIEQGPSPKMPAPGMPNWAKGVVAIITALGGTGIFTLGAKMLEKSDEQIRVLAEIRADVKNIRDDQARDNSRLDALEQHREKSTVRNETQFATLFAALAKEGYEPPRGASDANVRFRSTRNAKRPVVPVQSDGTELVIPPAPGD